MVHYLGVYREDTLHALAETDLADGDALAHARAIAGNQDAFEGLEALFLAFLDLDVNLDGVTGAKLGEFFLPLVLGNKLGQQRILHDNVRNLLVYNMSGVGMETVEQEGCAGRKLRPRPVVGQVANLRRGGNPPTTVFAALRRR